MSDPLDDLKSVLDSAQDQRAADIKRLASFTQDQLEYLARTDEVSDPETDNLELDRCP